MDEQQLKKAMLKKLLAQQSGAAVTEPEEADPTKDPDYIKKKAIHDIKLSVALEENPVDLPRVNLKPLDPEIMAQPEWEHPREARNREAMQAYEESQARRKKFIDAFKGGLTPKREMSDKEHEEMMKNFFRYLDGNGR